VQWAVERGAFNDLRLIEPAIRALDDNYPELADLVAEKILPGYGACIIPLLKPKLDLKGKKSDARRLRILHQLDPAGTLEFCKKALDEGSPEVKVAAIACLGKHEECISLLLEQTNSKNKAIRGAAFEALAEHDKPEVTKLFTEQIRGKALELLARPLRVIRNAQVVASLLEEGKRVFDLVIKGDPEQIPRYWEVLDCLEKRKDAEVEAFVLACFRQGDKVAKLKAAKNSHIAGADLMIRLTKLLYGVGSPTTLEVILDKREALPPTAFGYVLRSALRAWTAEQVFKEFSPLLAQTKGAGKAKSEMLERFVAVANWDEPSQFDPMDSDDDPATTREEALYKVAWDPRWLDAAIKANMQSLVCCLARPGHKAALDYLLKLGEAKKTSDSGLLIRALVRCQYAKVTDLFLDLIAKRVKGAKYFDYELQFLFESARHLPAADLPRLDAFAATLDEKFVDQFLEALGPLRQATSDRPALEG